MNLLTKIAMNVTAGVILYRSAQRKTAPNATFLHMLICLRVLKDGNAHEKMCAIISAFGAVMTYMAWRKKQ